MNKNVESHFSELPKIDIQRSQFDRSASHKTSFNTGELIPFYVDEVYPGDTFKVKTSAVVRLQTPLTPIMDNIYMDTFYFYVPYRIVWEHWKEFMGENSSSAWLPQVTYNVPSILPPSSTGWNVGTIADYMGIPTGVDTAGAGGSVGETYISALPFRAYALICDQWFRDQNVTDPVHVYYNDNNIQGTNGTNYITDTEKGGAPFKVSKYHDYFTSCLPSPQKGPTVTLMNGVNRADSFVPVYSRANSDVPGIGNIGVWYATGSGGNAGTIAKDSNGNVILSSSEAAVANRLVPKNLWADLSSMQVSINDLRLSFQLQKFYEKAARAGTRYREILKEHFSVTSSDARMMIPEYLGGHRFPLSIHQVANQTQSTNDFLGDLGAMSNTTDVHEDFIKSFEEHGLVIGVCCVRYDHSYPQGLEKFWSRKTNLDFYWPVFANIGEQPVYKREIMLSNTYTSNDDVFGYQEAWADLRYKPSRVSSEMRPNASNSLATWHLSDYYQSAPSLSDAWIREDKGNVDRVLSVQSSVSNQVFCDFYVQNIATRPLPMFSVPGLIDHH